MIMHTRVLLLVLFHSLAYFFFLFFLLFFKHLLNLVFNKYLVIFSYRFSAYLYIIFVFIFLSHCSVHSNSIYKLLGLHKHSCSLCCCFLYQTCFLNNFRIYPDGIYLFKVNNKNTGIMCENCPKLIKNTSKQHQRCSFGVSVISFVVFLLSF